jgi:hypothetical protein
VKKHSWHAKQKQKARCKKLKKWERFKMLLTRTLDYGNVQITSTAVFGGFAAFNRILRHNAPLRCVFLWSSGDRIPKGMPASRKFTGLQTRNRLTTSFAAIGQVLKWNLKMTNTLDARKARKTPYQQIRIIARFCQFHWSGSLELVYSYAAASFGAIRTTRLLKVLAGRGYITITNNQFTSNQAA